MHNSEREQRDLSRRTKFSGWCTRTRKTLAFPSSVGFESEGKTRAPGGRVSVRLLAFVLAVLAAGSQQIAFPQEPEARPNEARTATVCIYRIRMFMGAAAKIPISLDGERFSYLQNGRYWAVKIPAGEHLISATAWHLDDKIKLTMKADSINYVRAEFFQSGVFTARIRFSVVDAETAKADLRILKPGDSSQIRNHKIILSQP
jgi:hypothetical protein